jgi:hypothetical protein
MNVIVPAVAIFLAGTQVAGAATVTDYSDRSAFLAALDTSFIEDLNDFSLGGGLGASGGNGALVGTGPFLNNYQIDASPTSASGPLKFTFATPVTAFGADFDLSPSGLGAGLQIELFSAGTRIGGFPDAITELGWRFFGFTSSDSFDAVHVRLRDGATSTERHRIDNIIFGQATAPAVPLPAGLPLLLAGLGALVALRRR